MLELLNKVGFQLLLLSVKPWELEGDGCALLVVLYQLLLPLALPQFGIPQFGVARFGCVVAVVSRWITILPLRCLWVRHEFVE